MRRFGIVAMVLVGFVAGIAFVYSCGGGGSATSAAESTNVGIISLHETGYKYEPETGITEGNMVIDNRWSCFSIPNDSSSLLAELLYQNVDVSVAGTAKWKFEASFVSPGDTGFLDTTVYVEQNISGLGMFDTVSAIIPVSAGKEYVCLLITRDASDYFVGDQDFYVLTYKFN